MPTGKHGEEDLCVLCGGRDLRIYMKNGYALRSCSHCGLNFVQPLPAAEEIDAFYRNQESFFIGAGDSVFSEYLQRPESMQAPYLRRLRRIQRYVATGRLLDIGCSGGIFLDVAARAGYIAQGIEPSEKGVIFASRLGLDVRQGDFMNLEIPPDYYDVVTLYDVLEHLPDPWSALRRVCRTTAPGGIVVITTPNIGSLISRLQGREWSQIIPPEHLYLFSKSALKMALEDSGLKVVASRTMNGSGLWTTKMLLKALLRHCSVRRTPVADTGDRPASADGLRRRGRLTGCMEEVFEHLSPLYLPLAWSGLGEGLEMIAMKQRASCGRINDRTG